MSNNASNIQFIKANIQQIQQKPSLINNLNVIIQKYIDLPNLNADVDNSLQKLELLLSICHLVESLFKVSKNNKNKNQAIIKFLEQKAVVLAEILVSNEIASSLQNNQEFQIVADKLIQILVSLNKSFPQILVQKFVSKIILKESTTYQNLNSKQISSLYESFTNSALLSSLLEKINKRLNEVDKIQDKKVIQSICAFLISLPTFDLVQFKVSNLQQKQMTFIQEQQQQKPKQQFKKLFQSVFMKFLSVIQAHRQSAVGLYRKLDSKILSKMNNPLILSDYFLNKFKQDPQIQIQVLSCLFILVGKYGLQFQNFYPQLEELVKQKKDGLSVYQMKNSKRFFKLVESALKSSKVPFKTIQTMSKTIMSQIIEQQSEFAFWALPMFFNLAKKHRKLLDIFKEIPQIQLLSRHYNPKIRSLVNQLKKDLNKAQYLQIQKFAKIDCKKLTEKKVQELNEKLNHEQQAQFKIPGLFEDI